MNNFIKLFNNKLKIGFNTYYIYENNNKTSSKLTIGKKFKFLVIDNIEKTKLINTNDYKTNLFLEEGIKKKCIAFCVTHNNNFDGESDEDEDVFDLAQIRRKKGPIVNVKKI